MVSLCIDSRFVPDSDCITLGQAADQARPERSFSSGTAMGFATENVLKFGVQPLNLVTRIAARSINQRLCAPYCARDDQKMQKLTPLDQFGTLFVDLLGVRRLKIVMGRLTGWL